MLTVTPFALRPFRLALMAFTLLLAASVSLPAFAQNLNLFANPNPASTIKVDHGTWDAFLQRYLVIDNENVSRLRYAQSQADLPALNAYIDHLSAQKPSQLAPAEAFAYWANFYNALTVKVILDNYPVTSIRQIDGVFGFGGPWKRKRVSVEGQELSLDDMEHGILRPVFQDPRVHYAVNCASYSCPNLATQAFTASNLNALLDQGAIDYINHPRGVTIDRGRLQVSSIYSWFQEDFGGNDQALIAHLRQYAKPALAAELSSINRVWRDRYDWSLNDTQ